MAIKFRSRITPQAKEAVDSVVKPPPSLVDIIDDVLARKTQQYHFFRPSMLFGCDRQNVFHYLCAPMTPQTQDTRLMRILDNGTAIHSVIQGYLSDHPDWFFSPETRIYRQLEGAWIRGSCDGVLTRRSDGYRFAIEIKTISHNKFVKLTKAEEKHKFQASIYAKLLDIPYIMILYWDKNDHNLREYPVKHDPNKWEEVKSRVRYLKRFVDDRELPGFDPSTCDRTFCAFVAECRRKGAPV